MAVGNSVKSVFLSFLQNYINWTLFEVRFHFYPILGINNNVIETATPFFHSFFPVCRKQTKVEGGKKEEIFENSFASCLLNSDSNHPIQLRAAQVIILQPFSAACATTDF